MTDKFIKTLIILILCSSCNENEVIKKSKIRTTRSYSTKMVRGQISLSCPDNISESLESITIGSYTFGTVPKNESRVVDFKISKNGNFERSPNTPKHEIKKISTQEILHIFKENNHLFHSTTQVINLKRNLLYEEQVYPGNPDSSLLFIEIKFVEKFSIYNYSMIIDDDFMRKEFLRKNPILEVTIIEKFITHIKTLYTSKIKVKKHDQKLPLGLNR